MVQGTNALVLKDANGTGITIKSNMSHNVADSGMSIESNGNVNIGRTDGTTIPYLPMVMEEPSRFAGRQL